MPRIDPVEIENAHPKAATMLDGVNKALGITPNIMKTLAHSPAALQAYLGFGQALGAGHLSAALREQIALAVAGVNACEYCASAHSALGHRFGVSAEEQQANMQGQSSDPAVAAALTFAQKIVVNRGWIEDEDLELVRRAGYSDAEIIEIIATVAINIFTNYFNHIVQTDNDFPAVNTPAAAATQ